MSTQPTREEVLAGAVTHGGFVLYDMRYAVVPIEEYQRAAAALTEMDGAIVSGAITTADGVYAVVPMERHEQQAAVLERLKVAARRGWPTAKQWCEDLGVDFGGAS